MQVSLHGVDLVVHDCELRDERPPGHLAHMAGGGSVRAENRVPADRLPSLSNSSTTPRPRSEAYVSRLSLMVTPSDFITSMAFVRTSMVLPRILV